MSEDDLVLKLTEAFGPLGFSVMRSAPHRLRVSGTVDALVQAMKVLNSVGFNHLHTITAADYPEKGEFELSYWVGSVEGDLKAHVVQYVFRIPKAKAVVPSIMDVWPGAELREREEWEFFGITFEGNPNLKRLWLPEDWDEMPPLLKDYKLKRWVEDERARHGLVVRGE
jgi:NADH-quinone oxidoreductase subunit C